MKIISILMAKITLLLGNLIGRGSSFPGLVAQKIDRRIFSKFILPNKVIVVTGSSGKGSTSSIIAKVFEDSGYSVCHNDKGGNLPNGIITTLVKNSTLNGKIKSDVIVFEVDERYLKFICPYINPTDIVITNVTRDQPPRQGHIDLVINEIKKGINKNTKLYLNANDPVLEKFNYGNEIIYYGINKLDFSYEKNLFNALNQQRCPHCNAILNYDYYHIEDIGLYKCFKCKFKTPKAKYIVTSFKDNILEIDNNDKITLNNDMLYNIFNTMSAYSVLKEYGISGKKICESISNQNKNKKLHNTYKHNNRDVYVINNKSENASTYNQSMLYAYNDKSDKTVIIGWHEISRRYLFDDLSWIYDIEFELLKDNTNTFIVAGPQRYDIAVRLKYAGIDENKIKIHKDLYQAKEDIDKSKGTIYAILNFDYLNDFNTVMEELK